MASFADSLITERRKFPGSWHVEKTEGGHFVGKDANGFALAYVYTREGAGMNDKYMTEEEAFVMDSGIAKLPRAPGALVKGSANSSMQGPFVATVGSRAGLNPRG